MSPARAATAVRFLLRSLELRRANFLLALLAVVVGVSVTAMAGNLRADLGRKMSLELRSYGPNLLLTPADGATLGEAAVRDVGAMAATVAPTDVAPLLYAVGRAGETGVTVVGSDLVAARRIFPYWRVEGAWPEVAGAGLVGARLAARLGLAPGARLPLAVIGGEPVELAVSGIVATGEEEDERILVALPLLQRLARRPGQVSAAAARVEGRPDAVAAVAVRVEDADRAVAARPLRQVAEAEGQLLARLDLMMTLLGGLILVVSTLCVMTTLMAVVLQREPEIGLMRALGAGDGDIVWMLLGEATVLGAAGGLLGWALGALDARLFGRLLFGSAIAVRPEVLPLAVGLAIGVCWLGVLMPLRRALAVRPAEVLRGE